MMRMTNDYHDATDVRDADKSRCFGDWRHHDRTDIWFGRVLQETLTSTDSYLISHHDASNLQSTLIYLHPLHRRHHWRRPPHPLQCVAAWGRPICCSVLQTYLLQCVAVCGRPMCCSVLQCVDDLSEFYASLKAATPSSTHLVNQALPWWEQDSNSKTVTARHW